MWRRERVIEGVSARAAIELRTALGEAVAAQRAAARAAVRARAEPGNRGVDARAARDLAETPLLEALPEDTAVRTRLEEKARMYDAARGGAAAKKRTFLFAQPEDDDEDQDKEDNNKENKEEEEGRKGKRRDAHAVQDVIVEITEEDAATREAKRARHMAALDEVLCENSVRAQQDAARREAQRAKDAARIAHIRALQAAARRQNQHS